MDENKLEFVPENEDSDDQGEKKKLVLGGKSFRERPIEEPTQERVV